MGFKLNSTESEIQLNKPVDKGKKRKKKVQKSADGAGRRASPDVRDTEKFVPASPEGVDEEVAEATEVIEESEDKVALGKIILLVLSPPVVLLLLLYVWFFPLCQTFASTDIETVDHSPRFERFVVFCRGQVEFRDTILGTKSELVQNEEKTEERKKNAAKKQTAVSDEFNAESVYPGGDIPYNVDNEEHFSSLFERGADDTPIVAETMSDKNICRLVKVDTGQYKLVVNRANTDFSVVVLSYYSVTINGIDASCTPDDRPMLYIKDTGSAFDISKGTDNNGDYLLLENTEGTNISNDEAVRVLKTYESMIENVKWNFDSK